MGNVKESRTCCFYDDIYSKEGVKAQRRYPNEELCRFIGRNWLNSTTCLERQSIRILELGCGSCANLWMLAQEGFDTYGIDLSSEGLAVGRNVLQAKGVSARLFCGDMTDLPFEESYFDVVIDVFSANCLPLAAFETCLLSISRVLKPGGIFFFYTPSTASDAYIKPGPNNFIDEYTLDGLKNPEIAAFFGQDYPFRFSDASIREQLGCAGLTLEKLERVGRIYQNGAEYFEFLVGEARK
jgi:SAM-dependent methyltransferase